MSKGHIEDIFDIIETFVEDCPMLENVDVTHILHPRIMVDNELKYVIRIDGLIHIISVEVLDRKTSQLI